MSYDIYLSKEMCPRTYKERNKMSQIPYAPITGLIIYVIFCMSVDISYDLAVCSRYQSDLGKCH